MEIMAMTTSSSIKVKAEYTLFRRRQNGLVPKDVAVATGLA